MVVRSRPAAGGWALRLIGFGLAGVIGAGPLGLLAAAPAVQASPKPDPGTAAQVRVSGIPSSVAPGDVLTLDLVGSRLSPGSCVTAISVAWLPQSPMAEPTGPVAAWQASADRTGQRCDGRLPQQTVAVSVPDDFTGGSLAVQVAGAPARGKAPAVATWASTVVPISVTGLPPVARLFPQASPASAGQALVMDARTSWDPQGQALRYEWDLNGDGRFGDDPGSAEPGLAIIPPAQVATTTPRSGRLQDPGQIAAGLTRMRACQPTSDAFVSLEVAPEVVGRPLARAGMHRLWDMKVTWRDVNPERGRFDWTLLDQRVQQARAAGARVLLVLGMTPQWAAADPNAGDPRWGAGSASPPSDIQDWTAYVDAVVSRYGSQIAAYEVWNEANLKTFWTGTGPQMADLTATAYQVIKAKQPSAIVLAASVTTRLARPMLLFMNQYLDSLGRYGYPFDAFAIHTYPAGNAGTDARVADITAWQQVVVQRVGPDSTVLDKPVWDTEVNYGLAGPGPRPATSFTDEQGAALITQTFVDSRRLGIDATFWYMYTAQPFGLLGVQLWSGTPQSLSAWSAVRQRFAAGADPCVGPGQGSIPVAVRVIAADGRSSVAAVSVPTTVQVTANGSISAPAVLLPPGAAVSMQVTSPAPSEPMIGCLDVSGAGRFDRPVPLAGAATSAESLVPPSPGSHRISIAFWTAAGNPGCARTAADGAVQVASTTIGVGGPGPAGTKARASASLGPAIVVTAGVLDPSGARQGIVVRGTYSLDLPKGVPAAIATGRFVARLDSAWGIAGAKSGSGSHPVSALGTGYVLLRGTGKAAPAICLRADLRPGGNTFTTIGARGTPWQLQIAAKDIAVDLLGTRGKRIDATRFMASIGAANTGPTPAMPASCGSLARYLR